jgi:hypothetical protein
MGWLTDYFTLLLIGFGSAASLAELTLTMIGQAQIRGNGETLSVARSAVKNFVLSQEATTNNEAASLNRQFFFGLCRLAVNLISA